MQSRRIPSCSITWRTASSKSIGRSSDWFATLPSAMPTSLLRPIRRRISRPIRTTNGSGGIRRGGWKPERNTRCLPHGLRTAQIWVAPKASLIGRGGDGPIGGGPRISPLGEQQIAQADGNFRSIYLPLTRTIQPLLLAEFDMPDGSAVQGMRESTNVPAQALFMLNSDFVARQSQSVAFRVLRENPGTKAISRFNDRLATAYRVTLGSGVRLRQRSSAAARKLVERHANNPEKAWATVAQGLLASAEFRIVD